jgi:hypothetical protein
VPRFVRQSKAKATKHVGILCGIKVMVHANELLVDPQCSVDISVSKKLGHVLQLKRQFKVDLDDLINRNGRTCHLALVPAIFGQQQQRLFLNPSLCKKRHISASGHNPLRHS